MSTVQATTLQDRATLKSLGVERVIEGTPKAWVVAPLASGVPSIGDSFGVSSVTDIGVGRTGMNFTNPMMTSFYVGFGSVVYGNTGVQQVENKVGNSCELRCWNQTNALADPIHHTGGVIGDLA